MVPLGLRGGSTFGFLRELEGGESDVGNSRTRLLLASGLTSALPLADLLLALLLLLLFVLLRLVLVVFRLTALLMSGTLALRVARPLVASERPDTTLTRSESEPPDSSSFLTLFEPDIRL